MPGQGPLRPNTPISDDRFFYSLVTLACCCLFAWLLWTYHHGEVSAGVMALEHREIAFIRHFSRSYDPADRQMAQADPNAVTLRELYGIARAIGVFFRIPAAVLILGLALICMLRAAPSR